MDIFAHALWSYAIFFKNIRNARLAALFGVLPDILSFGPFFVMNIVAGNFHRGRPSMASIPSWISNSYNITHSLITFFAVFLIVYILTKHWFWPLTAWGIHIAIDVFTHSIRLFPTPFLWPVSDYRFGGISWGTPWFMALNYTALMVVFVLIARYRSKRKKKRK